jgi:1,4-dihydroxy-6-naphthoate synthase
MKIQFAFSPCPNDTFMFEPIYNKRIDLKGIEFEVIMEDVEYLNKAAQRRAFHLTKLSYNAFAGLTEHYQMLDSGSALGRGCGPLVISMNELTPGDLYNAKIAVPGMNTTAFFLLKYAFPQIKHVTEVHFSEIEQFVLERKFDAGVIIHENRFTYATRGLKKMIDLGAYWEETTGYPIPLGGIAVRRNLNHDLKSTLNSIITESVSYALGHPTEGTDFVREHAQEMEEKVMYDHIRLYVNDYSAFLNLEGRNAVEFLCNKVNDIPGKKVQHPLFVQP